MEPIYPNLTSIGTIDPATDVIPIVDVSLNTTYSATPNKLFGITGAVVGTSDTQNLTNKTLDNTNALTVKDTNLTLQDDGDATKQVKFQLSGITTGNTRTLTVPNASVTLASLTGTETLTNKTITSPTITGGSIDNTTITVDSISGHTTSTIVTVGGVQMNNGTIGTSGAVVTASIATGAVVPNSLFASTGTGWAWQSWVPSWSGLTIGNGTTVAAYVQTGKTVKGYVLITLGSTSAVSTNPSTTPPTTAASFYNNGSVNFPLGVGWLNAAGVNNLGFFYFAGSNTVMRIGYSASNVLTAASSTAPGTWATGNIIYLDFEYQAA